jgi:hypothetical protein
MPDESADASVEQVESEPQDSEAKSLDDAEMEGFVPGLYAPFDYSKEPFAKLDDDEKRVLRELVILKCRTDVASRRFEVEQRWEERLFERGYQHLLPRRGGGWSLPGEKSVWGPLASADSAALYSTNIIGRDRDILCAAIAREVPTVEFFPKKAEDPASIRAADAANDYKYIYQKNSGLRELLMEAADLYLSDERVLFYTRHVKDAEAFGFEEDGKTPRGAEITSLFGVLEHKLPMQTQHQREMDAIQVFTELDIASARAKYPWKADKIRPGTPGIGEIELDMIARVNTRLALLGSYVTGDALQRDVTEQMAWLRPAAFFDDTVTKEMREGLLKKFPKGCLAVYCGQEFCYARNESMDDHLHVSHALPGKGQNRRGPQSSELPIQKRLNAWIDLMDAFFRRTVPRRHYNADVFDIEALQAQDNVPGKSSPFQPPPNTDVNQLVFVEPTPTHQPTMPDFIQSFFGEVPASLSGAADSLFSATAEDEPGPTPVGTIRIRRDQALARAGLTWNAAKVAFAESTRQAAIAAAECREGTMSEYIPEKKSFVTVTANDLKGDVLCYPEYDAAFPESCTEREARFMKAIDGAALNPFYQALIKIPKNLRVMADNVRMSEMSVPGEASVKKQLMELEQLTQTGPIPNPQRLEVEQHTAEMEASGQLVPLEVAKQIEGIPPLVSSIPVANDASEDHGVEAMTCFEWMNDEEGQKFKNGDAQQQEAFQNVYLHWKAHTDTQAKLSQQAPPMPPRLTIGMKDLPASGKSQAAAKTGLMIPPGEFEKKDQIEMQRKIHEKVVPKAIPETYRKITRG